VTRVLVALGGNALQPAGGTGTWPEAVLQMRRTAQRLARIVADGDELVVTHGNGPQVGDLVREAELAETEVPAPPMYVADAESEGQTGFLIAQELSTALTRARSPRVVVPVVCRTEVAANDPSFRAPTKPVGRFYTAGEARRLATRRGWTLREDRARGGWRRVVPSPRPLRWLEAPAIRAALDLGLGRRCVFVVTGGGGVPVVRGRRGRWKGVDAVIDKDRAASLVARSLECAMLVIVTDVPGAAVGFGHPRPRWLRDVSADELRRFARAGEFGAGSMGPKVEAVLDFVDHGGRAAVITDLASLARALRGRAGTRVRAPRKGHDRTATNAPGRLRRGRQARLTSR
jgi:carbamate kinase